MGRQNSGQTAIHSSSIALLQERFRQLQRVKEMREEKEMFRFFPEESDGCTSPASRKYNTPQQKPCNLSFQSESSTNVAAQAISTCSQIKTCLSLWPDRSTHVADHNVINKSHCLNNINKSWFSNTTTPMFVVDDYDNECDVDTSLHL
ncbi:hypothetical protein POM88_014547 [Heracleum sosnowskyi]|uniref:Uncharacterized protein n=1 Tax=Heracleum sosnowskyi TaxID=360622 RepID=A0AAD8N4F1_9APIA|nr:hypothetical protein POM88_014547 [Heracleum sosnowskyi]